MTELLVGTDSGLYVLDEDGGAWNVAARFLEGAEINNVVREAAGTVLASSREAGLVRIDVGAGSVTRLGAGTLPSAVRAVAVAPSDPSIIYVGTEPAAIFCSRDGGATWRENARVAELRVERNWQYPGTMEPHIRDIMIDRENPERVLAAVQIGGVLRTEDGGATWEDITVDVDPDVHKIIQHPDDPDVYFAVTGGGGEYPHPTPEHRIKPPYPHGRPLYKSTDRGRTWTSISDDVPQSYGIPIAALGGSRPVLLAGVAFGVPPRWTARPEGAGAALIVSEDDGATWTAVSDGLPLPSPAMFDAIEVDARRRRFYAGTNEALYVSNDAQRGWTPVPLALPEIRVLSAG
jgi:photosystem II stability/assembly factor-like uncharacterized protein